MKRNFLAPGCPVAALLCIVVAALVCLAAGPPTSYDRFFTSETMRVDYVHTGGLGAEALALDRVASDGPWPGSRTNLVDDTNLGTYFFEVADRDSHQIIYSRGFGSIYGEWATTADVRSSTRTFQESLRFPWPKAPVRIQLKRRDAENAFRDLWSTDIDPRAPAARRQEPHSAGRVWPVFESGPPAEKVDLLLMSEGYTARQIPKFHADAARLVNALFSYEPFKSRKSDFNVRGLDLPSDESGITNPRQGLFRRTPLSAQYGVFGLERYILSYDNRALREAASAAPYDVVEILVNDNEFGGGGIFNLQSTVAVDNPLAERVFVHEFGHNLAGLGDEYTGNVTYETSAAERPEPWEPNLTALKNPAALKWRDLVEAGTPIPTPPSFAGRVGAFEGGGYVEHGLYRPEAACIMGSTGALGFCRVCQRAINRAIDRFGR
ncbi:MAG TPA: M64 family metallopeptidase [Vicinamibacterales bacterium]|nr:M64 family metallopeptidase [Vicinamibacterales bacterium]